MKANLSKSLIPAVLVIAGLAAGTGLLAGYVDGPSKAPQAVVESECDGCPRLNTPACCKVTGICADPQNCTTPCIGTAANAAPCPGMAQDGASCAGMAAAATPCTAMNATPTPCTGAEGCPMPCCQKPGQTPPAGCTLANPQPTGCPFMNASGQPASPCGAGGCTQQK